LLFSWPFVKGEGSLPSSHEPVTGIYLEPDESILQQNIVSNNVPR